MGIMKKDILRKVSFRVGAHSVMIIPDKHPIIVAQLPHMPLRCFPFRGRCACRRRLIGGHLSDQFFCRDVSRAMEEWI